MRKLRAAVCLMLLVLLIPVVIRLRSRLPMDVQPLIEKKYGGWAGTLQTNAILADIYDALAAFNTSYVAANSKHKPKKPEQYPRPWAKKKTKRIGRDAIPITQFDNWWKRGKH